MRAPAHDLGVDHVLGLVDQDQKAQAGGRSHGRHRQADQRDDGVAQQVADDGNQAGDKGQRDQRGRIGQRQIPVGQDQQQEESREQRVERGDPELRSDDLAESFAEQRDAPVQRVDQRRALERNVAHGSERADQQAHIGMQQA